VINPTVTTPTVANNNRRARLVFAIRRRPMIPPSMFVAIYSGAKIGS